MKIKQLPLIISFFLITTTSSATFVAFAPNLDGVNDCTSGAVNGCFKAPDEAAIPNPVTQDPNDGILLVWDELQNFTLTQDLRVDRVADENAPFVIPDGNGFIILAGTVVSSHYIQWDPGMGSEDRVDTSLQFDSDIFAFITGDQNLFDSDFLGLVGIDYSDFGLRGLENGDTTVYGSDFSQVDISWFATSPGDWTRVITAFSPTAVPVPAAFPLFLGALAGMGLFRRRR